MRDIKRRIASVKNTQQITKAMEMVAAAKLRRVQNQVVASRPFANKLREVLGRLVASARGNEGAGALEHPLIEVRSVERVLYVVIAADRGLAGGYNANVLRRFQQTYTADDRQKGVVVIGRKARDFVRKMGIEPLEEHILLGDEIDFHKAKAIANDLMDAFTQRHYDEIHVIYTEFVSAISQRPKVERLLPISQSAAEEASDHGTSTDEGVVEGVEYLYEPSPDAVLNILLPRYVETEVYRALMEAKASELGARMTAMRSASDNAGEMIEALTLSFNRARQASITTEISEIVGGAEALAGSG